MSDLVGTNEGRDDCETCEASTHCSQLRLALAILGESLTESPNIATSQRYQGILHLLGEAGWNYPHSGHLCKLSDHRDLVRALTDELILLAKRRPDITRRMQSLADGRREHALTDASPRRPVMNPSLYEEETSCE